MLWSRQASATSTWSSLGDGGRFTATRTTSPGRMLQFRGYADYMETEPFRHAFGVERLLEIARARPNRDHVFRSGLVALPPFDDC